MKKNLGLTDRAIRVLAAIVIAILYFTKTVSGSLALFLGIIALVLIFTSLINFCPLYSVFGINTSKKKK